MTSIRNIMSFCAISAVVFSISGCGSSQTENDSSSTEQVSESSALEEPEKPEKAEVEEELPAGMKLMSASDCNACHKMDVKLVGPSYAEIAKKYKDASDEVVKKLTANILNGSSGVWGQVAMPGHSTLEKADVEVMVKYILSVNK